MTWPVPQLAWLCPAGGLVAGSPAAGGSQQSRPPGGTATVSGTVVEGDARTPVPFANVDLANSQPANGARYSTTTTENGTFTFSNVRAGSYQLAASTATFALTFHRGA